MALNNKKVGCQKTANFLEYYYISRRINLCMEFQNETCTFRER